MDRSAYIIHKDGDKWIVESNDSGVIRKSEHTSRVKALNSFFHNHPGVRQFIIAILPTKDEA